MRCEEYVPNGAGGCNRQCFNEAKVRLTIAPKGTAHPPRKTLNVCHQHGKLLQEQEIIIETESI